MAVTPWDRQPIVVVTNNMIEEFDSSKCYLGKLCKKGHEWKNTRQSLRYRSSRSCVTCDGTSSIPISTAQRFWNRVDKSGDCWLWLGFKDAAGYGTFSRRNKTHRAHRIAWELTYGSIPDGLVICHRCDCPSCVKVDHLFLGTNADNNRDKVTKNRHVKGSKVGTSKLTSCQVAKIRQLNKQGMLPSKIAPLFGISHTNVCRILKKESWNHLE